MKSLAPPAVFMNAYQAEQFAAFAKRHAEDEKTARECGEESLGHITEIRPFPCFVPGMLAVVVGDDMTAKLLYPEPRPVPKDPLFQHAGPLMEVRPMLLMLHVAPGWMRDWQLSHGARMDAPDVIPGGGCEFFAADEEAYGALQIHARREDD